MGERRGNSGVVVRTEGLRVSVRDGRVRACRVRSAVRVERSARACATRDQVKWLM